MGMFYKGLDEAIKNVRKMNEQDLLDCIDGLYGRDNLKSDYSFENLQHEAIMQVKRDFTITDSEEYKTAQFWIKVYQSTKKYENAIRRVFQTRPRSGGFILYEYVFNPEKLKIRRKEYRYSMTLLSKEIGCNPSNLSRIESGKSSPSVAILGKIAGLLEVSPSYFFDKVKID